MTTCEGLPFTLMMTFRLPSTPFGGRNRVRGQCPTNDKVTDGHAESSKDQEGSSSDLVHEEERCCWKDDEQHLLNATGDEVYVAL